MVFGSLARAEVTSGSDVDWTLLIDGLSNAQHLDASLEIQDRLDEVDARGPGQEGIFGGLAFSHEIVHHIGGSDDTNRNITQRLLLLLESRALSGEDVHRRVVRNVLKRYLTEDLGWIRGTVTVPRFLLNDITRYWRTVAVDFAYKRRQRRGSGWALRTVKLRMSRKLTYVAGLLSCFSVAIDPILSNEPEGEPNDSERTHPLIEHLLILTRRPPLELLATAVLPFEQLRDAANRVFSSYDKFLAMLDDAESRDRLKGLTPLEADSEPLYQQARGISREFQGGLDEVFLTDNGTPFFELTKKYAIF